MGLSLAAFQGELYVSGTMMTAECFVSLTDAHLSYVKLADRAKGDNSQDGDEQQSNDYYTHQVTIITDDPDHDKSTGEESEEHSKPSLGASSADGKSITISIEDAYPGDIYRLQYRIINQGTIPVELNLGSISEQPQLKVESSLNPGERLNPGKHCDEELLITVNESAEGQNNYSFSIELNYSQWKGN